MSVEAQIIKSILNTYDSMSGQSINFQKSRIFFSSNVRLHKQIEISESWAFGMTSQQESIFVSLFEEINF